MIGKKRKPEDDLISRLGEHMLKQINDNLLKQDSAGEEIEKARAEGYGNGFADGIRTASVCYLTAFAVGMRRVFKFEGNKLADFLNGVDYSARNSFSSKKNVDTMLEKMGIEIRMDEEERRIHLKEKRPVLCEKCIMGSPISSGSWDCDAIDGATAGKTECEFFRGMDDNAEKN